MKVKIWTLTLLWGTISYTAFGIMSSPLIRIFLLLIATGVSIHVLSIKTLRKEVRSDAKENGPPTF
jgi:hypothetical protein